MRLAGKTAIITGAARGIGEAQARLFAAEGAQLVVSDVLETEGEAVCAAIRDAGGEALFVRADISLDQDWAKLIGGATEAFGRLDILVNNAAISGAAVSHMDDIDAWERLMAVNARGAYLGCRRAAELMQAAGRGSIVNISSFAGMIALDKGHPGYYASKGAVRSLTKAMALRLAPHGVRVNSVHPGFFPRMVSPEGDSKDPPEAANVPMRRIGRPMEVAYGALFLASDEASYITGAELVIDGGYIAQ